MGRRKKRKKSTADQKLTYILIISILLLIFTFYTDKNDIHLSNFTNTNNTLSEETSKEKTTSLQTNNSQLIIYFFDVGQADCILIGNEDKYMLIDAGNNSDGKLISNYLKNNLNIESLEYVIGTHNHEDHIGGLDDIINNLNVKKIYMPFVSLTTTQTYENVEESALNKNLNIENPTVGDTFYLGTAKLEVMSINNEEPTNKNESSIILEMQFGSLKYLFTGDAEIENENFRKWNDIDVLKVAHHGSDTSSSESFLKQTKPEISIVSVGPNNSYDLPKENILNRITKIGSKIYRTDTVGTIVLTSDGTENTVSTLNLCLDGNSR